MIEPDPRGPPLWADAALSLHELTIGDVELGTLSQEKGEPVAGFTCPNCPQPYRPRERCICVPPEPPEGYPYGFDAGQAPTLSCRPRDDLNEMRGCGLPYTYTKRCRECNTKMGRWAGARRDARDVAFVADAVCEARMAFLTLTMPNTTVRGPMTDEVRVQAVRDFKKQVGQWKRTKGPKENLYGGIDYYEVTTKHLGGGWWSLNPHAHCMVVLARYWPQAEIQDSWNRGIVDIRAVRSAKRTVLYATKYATKHRLAGVRTKERWGACRTAVLSALGESLRTPSIESSDVEPASD